MPPLTEGPISRRFGAALVAALTVCVPLGGCDDAGEASGSSTAAPGYLQLHEALFVPACASASCHSGPVAAGNLSFDDPEEAYRRLIEDAPARQPARDAGLRLVVPGDAAASFLHRKLGDTAEALDAEGLGGPMPLAQPPVGSDAVAAVAAWIDAGAAYDGAAFVLSESSETEIVPRYVACDATDDAGLRACLGDAPDPATTQRLYTPPITVPAGAEVIMCSFLDAPEETLRIRAARGLQMTGGHHAAVFVGLTSPPTDEPVSCEEIEMGALRFVAGAGGAGAQDTVLPDGSALTIAAGQRIVIQSHYINLSPDPQVVMDAVDLELTTVEESPTNVDAFTMVDSDLDIPVGAEDFERVKTCTVDEPMDILLMLGHTHDFGVLFTLEFVREGIPELLYHATHGPTLRANPDILTFDQPLHLDPGDVIRMTCAWTNTTDHALGWPEEMCVGLMYYSPGRGYLMCDTNDETPVLQSGDEPLDPEAGCVGPGDAGNALGVGRYCTVGGGECDDTAEPTLCLAEFQPEATYSSVILCQDDAVCGEGASCVFEGPGSACVPTVCQ